MSAQTTAELAGMAIATRLDCTPEEYHAIDSSVSRSQLETFIESPVLYHGRHILKLPEWQKKPTDAMELGSALHLCAISNKPPGEIVTVIPRDVLTSNGQRRGKAWDGWKEEHDGELCLMPDAVMKLVMMWQSMRDDPHVSLLLNAPGPIETAWEWEDLDTGLLLRFMADKIAAVGDVAVVVDWKTTRHQSPRAFGRDAWSRGYHRQEAFYCRGARAAGYDVEGMAWGAVGNEPPNEVIVYETGPRERELGERQVARALADLKRRLDTDDWSSPYRGTVQPLLFPAYAFYEED